MKLSGIREINMKHFCAFILIAVILCAGCCGENSKSSNISRPERRLLTEIGEMKHQPEIVPDGPCYFEIRGKYGTPNEYNNEFFKLEYDDSAILKYWFRRYRKSSCEEFRFFDPREDWHYLFGRGSFKTLDFYKFYIKWRQFNADIVGRSNLPGGNMDSDIGKYTKYLETNLSRETILKYFPEVKCAIIIKKPKRIKMDLYHLFESMNTWEIDPQFEFDSTSEKGK